MDFMNVKNGGYVSGFAVTQADLQVMNLWLAMASEPIAAIALKI